jgi:type IV fimbrial biogenesis protein FimT
MAKRTFAGGQRGVSLVEVCCTVSIVAALAGAIVPSFDSLRVRRAVDGVAAELATELHFARTEAVSRREGVRWSVSHVGTGSCVVVHTGSAADCTCSADGVAVCVPGTQLIKSTYFPASGRVLVTANVASMRFDPVNGTTTPAGTVRIAAAGGAPAVHHVVSILGRVRTCTPSGSAPGLRPC